MESDQQLQAEFKEDPLRTLQKFQYQPWVNDKLIYRIAVAFLGFIVLSICIGVMILMGDHDPASKTPFEVPDILIATASAAIGALAGLLTPTPGSGNND